MHDNRQDHSRRIDGYVPLAVGDLPSEWRDSAVKERFVARRSSPDVTGPAYINLETIFRLGSTPPTTGTFMFGYLAALWSLIVRLQKSRPSRETRGDLKSTRGSQIAAGIMIIYSLKNSWQRRQGALAYSHLGSANDDERDQ